ncbi:MAG: hypothetical protein ABR976_15025 [Terracidiphilus sp.]
MARGLQLYAAVTAGDWISIFVRRPGGVMPRYNIGATIRDALHEIRLLRNCLEGQIDRLDRVERELAALISGCTDRADSRIPNGLGQVAHNLEMQPHANGSAVVSIDGGREFILARQLAEVFEFIATGDKDRSGKDSLVGWRLRTEILAFLENSAGRRFHPRYVNNLVNRLKYALRKAGYDSSLIQTHRQKGVRFAIKRGARTLPDVSPSDRGQSVARRDREAPEIEPPSTVHPR